MNREIFEENTLRRYLLGELSDDEQARVEDAAFADVDLLAFVQTIENDLIDEYARGELTASEKRNFERMFLTSDERQKKIEFARAFAQTEQKNAASSEFETRRTDGKKIGFWQTLSSLFAKPQFAFGALVLLVLLGGAAIYFNSRKGDAEIASQKTPTQTPIQTSNQTANDSNIQTAENSAPIASPTIETPAEKSNQNKPATIQTPAPKVSPTPQTRSETRDTAPTFAALVFPVGMTRDGGSGGKVLQLKLAPDVKTARLVFNLEKGDEYKNYQIELRGKNSGVLRTSVVRSGNNVVLNVPAAKLAAGRYEAALSGTIGNQSSTIGYYDFEIVKP